MSILRKRGVEGRGSEGGERKREGEGSERKRESACVWTVEGLKTNGRNRGVGWGEGGCQNEKWRGRGMERDARREGSFLFSVLS